VLLAHDLKIAGGSTTLSPPYIVCVLVASARFSIGGSAAANCGFLLSGSTGCYRDAADLGFDGSRPYSV
jgi:hypothetical protein